MSPRSGAKARVVLVLAVVAGCRGESTSTPVPTTTVASAPAASSAFQAAAGAAAATASALEPSPALGAAAETATPAAPAAAPSEPPLLGPDGAPLGQTDERPSVDSELFRRRMRALGDAILTGDAELGRAAFFPLVAYAQVKDVQKPERDYRFRLLANFERDVRAYRKALGTDAAGAELVAVEVPEDKAQWMPKGKEGNRLGYYRVLRSRLRFKLPNSKERTFELTSLISWRGQWYVVHLKGFE